MLIICYMFSTPTLLQVVLQRVSSGVWCHLPKLQGSWRTHNLTVSGSMSSLDKTESKNPQDKKEHVMEHLFAGAAAGN